MKRLASALLVLAALFLGGWIGATYAGTSVLVACEREGQVFFEAFAYRERMAITCTAPRPAMPFEPVR